MKNTSLVTWNFHIKSSFFMSQYLYIFNHFNNQNLNIHMKNPLKVGVISHDLLLRNLVLRHGFILKFQFIHNILLILSPNPSLSYIFIIHFEEEWYTLLWVILTIHTPIRRVVLPRAWMSSHLIRIWTYVQPSTLFKGFLDVWNLWTTRPRHVFFQLFNLSFKSRVKKFTLIKLKIYLI